MSTGLGEHRAEQEKLVLPSARMPDHHVLLRRICLHDDEEVRRCRQDLLKHSALHPANTRTLPGTKRLFIRGLDLN